MAKNIKLSKAGVDKLSLTTEGQNMYWDSALPGFGLRIGTQRKTYIVQKKIAGKAVRVTLGIHGQITAEQARREALSTLSEMTKGINPIDIKRENNVRGITLREVLADFFQSRKNLKPRTIEDYGNIMEACFKDWMRKEMLSITKDMVEKRHKKIGEKSPAYANSAMRVLRAVFNYAIGKYEDSKGKSLIYENPVTRLSKTRAWYKVKRRDDYIKPEELPLFFKALESVSSDIMRDYFQFLLFTGLRRQEAASLKWDQIDFNDSTFTILDTKNDEILLLPMSGHIKTLLKRRVTNRGDSEYVFPGDGKTGHIVEPKKQFLKIKSAINPKLTIHGLRRTFITCAESIDLPYYAIKRLVNHKMSGDVTAGYIVADVERLRKPMEKIANKILENTVQKKKGKVIPITG